MALEFGILGPLEVRDGDRPIEVRGVKQRLLLAILLLHANEVVSADTLRDALWGERQPATGTKALQMQIHELRQILGATTVATQAPGYRLVVDDGALDLSRFEAMLANTGRGTDPTAVSDQLRAALDLWRGPVLADVDPDGVLDAEAARLEDLRVRATEDRIQADLELGRDADVIAELEQLAAQNPLRERPRAQLMLALYRSGRQADALAVYRDARALLVDELGIEPGPELRDLQARILAHDPSLEAIGSSPPVEPVAAAAAEALVGRDRELAALLPIVNGALAGSGAVVLLAGEPGIGKSRLAETLAAHAHARGAAVAVGRCWETGGATAYWPWAQALGAHIRQTGAEVFEPDAAQLATIVPGLGGGAPVRSLEIDGGRMRMFTAVAGYLRRAAARQPMALFLDDLHAADFPSLLLLRFVAAEVPQGRILIVGCYRDTEPRTVLNEILPDLMREPAVHRHPLRPLTPDGTASVLELVTGAAPDAELVKHVHARTEGNPLFAVEIGRLLAAEGQADTTAAAIPAGVTEAIERRIGNRSEPCRDVLVLASVIGREFGIESLVHASARDEDVVLEALEEAEAAKLIGPIPGVTDRLRFSHVLVRDALYDALPAARRLRLHRQVGQAFEDLYAQNPDPHLSELANHFLLAGSGSVEAAVEYARRAGDHAVSLYAWEDAAQHYESALQALERSHAGDATRVCALLLALGEALSRAGNEADSKTALRRAASLAEQEGRPDYLARAALAYGGRIPWARESTDPELVPMLERGLAAATADDAMRVRLLAFLSGARRDDARRDRRQALAEEALAIAERLDDPGALAVALEAYFNGADGPDMIDSWLQVTGRLIDLSERADDKEHLYTAHHYRMDTFWFLCDRAGMDVEVDILDRLAAELRQPVQQWAYGTARTILALIEGRFEDAERLIAQTFAIGQAASTWNAAASQRLALFQLRREQGRLLELADAMARSVHEFPTLLRFEAALALLYVELDRHAEAQTVIEDLTSRDLAVEHVDAEWLFSVVTLAEAVAMTGDEPRASQLYSLLLPYAELYAFSPAEATGGCVARILGVLATTVGLLADAEEHLIRAIEIEQRMRAEPWVGHAQLALAQTLAARGEGQRSGELLAQARATYTRLGMTSWAARATRT